VNEQNIIVERENNGGKRSAIKSRNKNCIILKQRGIVNFRRGSRLRRLRLRYPGHVYTKNSSVKKIYNKLARVLTITRNQSN